MKFLKITAAILFLAILTACKSGQPVQTSEAVSETEASAVTTSSATAATTETESETVPETELAEIAEENEIEYVEISPYYYREFIDFDFIEDYQGTTDIGGLADRAVEFFKTTDEYAESMKNIDEFSDGEFSDYIADGVIVPKFRTAYPNDYDGDGRAETFIAVDMPVCYNYSNILTSFYIYADWVEKMTLLDVSGRPDANAVFLNYGRDKQIAFGGDMSPYGSVCHLYGVKDGDPVLLYSEQAGLEKRACFLRSHGFQAAERFMYYNTSAREYRQIASVQIPLEKLKALDTSGSLNSVFEENGDRFSAWIVGGKYYCIKVMFEFADVYTYENGTFTLMTDPPVGLNIPDSVMPCVKEIDIDEAIAGMQPPEEPYGQVSEGHEFIDYNFISNYPDTTDIGSLEDKALEFIKATDFYADSIKNADRFKWESFMHEAIGDAEFKEKMRRLDEEQAAAFAVYLDENGNVQPKLSAAYPADYDGDGREEAFIIVDMPVIMNDYPVIRSFTVFSDSSGEMQLLTDFSGAYPVVLLDYGKFKHIIIGGYGIMGADDHTVLYGVIDGKAAELDGGRVSYYKENCFLASYGWQGGGGFMYFDTVKQAYRGVYSASVSIEKIREMDKDNVFEKYYEWYEKGDYASFSLIGGKYYCASFGPMDTGVIYTYEDGKFIRQKNCHARSGGGANIDIDKALAEMKPVSDPISPVSKGSEFIDFEFIENYQGTTDIGDLGDKAVKYIKNSTFCETSNKHADKFSDEKFAAYFDSDGNIVPKLLTAYPNDYNGDGKTETFIIVEMPYYIGYEEIAVMRDYLIFADSDGNVGMYNQFSGFDPEKGVTLLNYGKYKHILFHADGYDEEDEDTALYGAYTLDGRAAVYYDSDFDGSGVIKKDGCYLSVSDGYASEYFMYFDTVTQDYITLLGKNYGSSMPAPLGTGQAAKIRPVQK